MNLKKKVKFNKNSQHSAVLINMACFWRPTVMQTRLIIMSLRAANHITYMNN